MTPNARIHQIYYRPDQLAGLDPAFVPYDNSGSPHPEQREYWVFLQNFLNGTVHRYDLCGFVSWKFSRKCHLTGKRFLEFVHSNPGYDVYFVNPFPLTMAWPNPWEQGDFYHPGLLDFTQGVFDRIGLPIALRDLHIPKQHYAYCNFWVGTPRFWERYMAFTRPIYDYLLGSASAKEKEFLWQRACVSIDSPYFPFVFERLFSTLLATDKQIRALPYVFDGNELGRKFQGSKLHLASALVAEMSNDGDSELDNFRRMAAAFVREEGARLKEKTIKAKQSSWFRKNPLVVKSLLMARSRLQRLI